MTTPASARGGTTVRSTLQKAALAVGVVFLAVGVLGFIPGVTSNYSDMMFATHESDALLLGIFQVSILHNIVHLLFGVAGLALARTHAGSLSFLLWGGLLGGWFISKDAGEGATDRRATTPTPPAA